jgi:MFS family permease
MNRLIGTALGLLAASLLLLSRVASYFQVIVYALVMGLAGGFVIVIFFTFWGRIFGRSHLGQIQGAAQTLTVLASAIGPIILAQTFERTGSYASIFYLLAGVVLILGLSAWLVSLPAPLPLTVRK